MQTTQNIFTVHVWSNEGAVTDNLHYAVVDDAQLKDLHAR